MRSFSGLDLWELRARPGVALLHIPVAVLFQRGLIRLRASAEKHSLGGEGNGGEGEGEGGAREPISHPVNCFPCQYLTKQLEEGRVYLCSSPSCRRVTEAETRAG